jgi:hypothetical protein
MQKINWEMMTQFVFPEQLGAVEEVLSVDIKPVWQQVETEDSIRLIGIYHIAATARFNPEELPVYRDGTFVEELEFDGNNGYFEYALPLEVDLPREKVALECQPQVCINDVSFFVYDGSNCTFKWDVDCQFDETVEGALFQYDQEDYEAQPFPQEPEMHVEPPEYFESVHLPERPQYPMQEPPIIELAPAYDDVVFDDEVEEEIHFGGADGIFPEEPQHQVLAEIESPNEPALVKGQPSAEAARVEEKYDEQHHAIHDSTSIEAAVPEAILKKAETIETSEELTQEAPEVEYEEIEEPQVVQARNQYFPTDADDFYSELTESFTLLNISNRTYRE